MEILNNVKRAVAAVVATVAMALPTYSADTNAVVWTDLTTELNDVDPRLQLGTYIQNVSSNAVKDTVIPIVEEYVSPITTNVLKQASNITENAVNELVRTNSVLSGGPYLTEGWATNQTEGGYVSVSNAAMAAAALTNDVVRLSTGGTVEGPLYAVVTNFLPATCTTNDFWVFDGDGTILRWGYGPVFWGWGYRGTNENNNTIWANDINAGLCKSVCYNIYEEDTGSSRFFVNESISSEYCFFPVVIDGVPDGLYPDTLSMVTNNGHIVEIAIGASFDEGDTHIHIGPYYFRRYGGYEIVTSRVATVSDIAAIPNPDYTTNNTELVQSIKEVAQEKLSNVQISAIDTVVDERKTVVSYTDGTTAELDIVGELTSESIPHIYYASNVVIGSAVTRIQTGVFRSSNLTSIKIPNSITSIMGAAFMDCKNIRSMTIGDGVTSIGGAAFYNCSGLTSVTIGNGVTSIGSSAFTGCSGLTSVTFLGKTIEQVQNIEDESGTKQYPWGIEDTSIITTWNDASKEWVEKRMMTSISYSNLTNLMLNGMLTSGAQYRITNYVATVTEMDDLKSANHPFDIIVTADSTNAINEVARAIQHEGDSYFSKCNLSAWKVWYTTNNDNRLYTWGDTESGKGIVYRLIDEYGNDCYYDFKGFIFTNEIYQSYVYTFRGTNIVDDGSLYMIENEPMASHNVIQAGTFEQGGILSLPRISIGAYSINNKLEHGCSDISLGEVCTDNRFGARCYQIFAGDRMEGNIFEPYCGQIIFGSGSFEEGSAIISTLGNDYYNIKIESRVNLLVLYAQNAIQNNEPYQYVEVKSGISNVTITDTNANQTFHTTYQPTNSTTINVVIPSGN